MRRLLLVLISAVTLTSCDDSSGRPVAPTAPSAPAPTTPSILSLEITGNSNLTMLSETSQLVATARFSDGSVRDVSAEVTWRSINPGIVAVSTTGLLSAVAPGRAIVRAELQTRISVREVTVLPSGTFILRGTVTEPGSLPVFTAQVTIVGGPHAGRSTMTAGNGSYELYGVSETLTVTVTKDEYVLQTKSVTLTQDSVLDFELQPVVPPLSLAGPYRVTFTAAPQCTIRLPEPARTRSYDALIHQVGARVEFELINANFALNPVDGRGRRFSGRLLNNRLGFAIGDTYYSYFEDIVEQLTPTTYVTITGLGNAAAPMAQSITGNLEGVIAVWDAPNGFYNPGPRVRTDCRGTHQFELARQ